MRWFLALHQHTISRFFEQRCDDSILCMCENAPPPSMNQCLQCVMDGAGDVLHLIPDYLKDVSSDVAGATVS